MIKKPIDWDGKIKEYTKDDDTHKKKVNAFKKYLDSEAEAVNLEKKIKRISLMVRFYQLLITIFLILGLMLIGIGLLIAIKLSWNFLTGA